MNKSKLNITLSHNLILNLGTFFDSYLILTKNYD